MSDRRKGRARGEGVIPEASEHQHARMFARWLQSQRYDFTHVPAEGTRSVSRGMKLKLEGLSKGFPDYVIFLGWGVTMLLELKRRGGTLTEQQVEWLQEKSNRNGIRAFVAYGAQEAIDIVMEESRKLSALMRGRDKSTGFWEK